MLQPSSFKDVCHCKIKKKKKKQPGALAKALPDIIMETDITAIKDEWKTFMAVKNSNLPAFNCDIGTSTITG